MPPPLVSTPAIRVPPGFSVTAPDVVEISNVPPIPTLILAASARDVLLATCNPPAPNAVTVPIVLVLLRNEAVPATPLPLVRTPATRLAPAASEMPPESVDRSTVPVLVALTRPARTSALLSTTVKMPPFAVTGPMVPTWFTGFGSDRLPAMPPVLLTTPAISVPPAPWVTSPADVVTSTVPPVPTLTLPARTKACLLTTVSCPPAVRPEIVPIWFCAPASVTPPAMLPLLVTTPAISVPVLTWVSPPDVVEISAVPMLDTVTSPANASAWLFTTPSEPPAVTPAMVPIWFAAPFSDRAPAMPPVLVRVPAISVPTVPCVTPPTAVVRSTIPVLPALTLPASARAWLFTTVNVPPAVRPEIVPI